MKSIILRDIIMHLGCVQSRPIVRAHFPEPELKSVGGVQSLVDGIWRRDGADAVDVVVGLVD